MNTSTCARERTPNSAPLPDDLRRFLAALVDQHGEHEARRIVGLSRSAFSRALAGLGVYPGTVALARLGLAQVPDSAWGQP